MSALPPAWSDTFKCFIIPGKSWRVVGQARGLITDIATRQITFRSGADRTSSFIWERFALHGSVPLFSTITVDGGTEAGGAAIEEAVFNDASGLSSAIRQDLTGGTFNTIRGLVVLTLVRDWFREAPYVELVERTNIEANSTPGGADVLRTLLLHLPSGAFPTFSQIVYVVRTLSGAPAAGADPTTIVQVPHTLRISRRPADAAQAELDSSLKVRV